MGRGRNMTNTGKSVSEALILESINPQYDERLFIEFPEKYKFRTCCVQILFWMSKQKQKNNFCTQLVLNFYFSGNSMNNLLSYCGLTNARIRASKKVLPVFAAVCWVGHYYFGAALPRTHFTVVMKIEKHNMSIWSSLVKIW